MVGSARALFLEKDRSAKAELGDNNREWQCCGKDVERREKRRKGKNWGEGFRAKALISILPR